jgi:hypothetical protein
MAEVEPMLTQVEQASTSGTAALIQREVVQTTLYLSAHLIAVVCPRGHLVSRNFKTWLP